MREQRRSIRIRIPGGKARLRIDAREIESEVVDIAFGGLAIDGIIDADPGVTTIELWWPALRGATARAEIVRVDRDRGRTALRFVESNRGLRDLVSDLARWPVAPASGGTSRARGR